jgi:hypothetical protein
MLIVALLLTSWSAADVTIEQIKDLTKVYLRDSTEVPMSVDVTTIVTDPNGKVTHKGHLVEATTFKGYNQGAGSFSVRATKQGLTPFGRWEAMSGEFAAFMSGTVLFRKDNPQTELKQPAVAVVVHDANCSALDANPNFVFPRHLCGTTEITFASGPQGDLVMQHATFDSKGSPARVKVAHLGIVELRSYHYDVDFQLKTLPGEAKPYLWPLKTVVTATSDKGTVTVTNLYSAKP